MITKEDVVIEPAGAGYVSEFTVTPIVADGGLQQQVVIRMSPNPGYYFREFYYTAQFGYGYVAPVSGTRDYNPVTFYEANHSGTYDYTFILESLIARFTSGPTPPTHESAVLLSLVSSPQRVGTLTGGGQKSGAVGSSVSFTANAAVSAASSGVYRFSHWIDDEGAKHKTKQLSKTFTLKSGYTTSNPERKIFTAYFVPYTGLILRSGDSGLILRGSNNKILRDE